MKTDAAIEHDRRNNRVRHKEDSQNTNVEPHLAPYTASCNAVCTCHYASLSCFCAIGIWHQLDGLCIDQWLEFLSPFQIFFQIIKWRHSCVGIKGSIFIDLRGSMAEFVQGGRNPSVYISIHPRSRSLSTQSFCPRSILALFVLYSTWFES